MTGKRQDPDTPSPPEDGSGDGRLGRLVAQLPEEAPPDWLDANIRATAHDAARQAAQHQPAGKAARTRQRPRFNRWLPIGGTLASALFAVLILLGQPRQHGDTPVAAGAPATSGAAPATAPAPAPAASPAPVAHSTAADAVSGAPTPAPAPANMPSERDEARAGTTDPGGPAPSLPPAAVPGPAPTPTPTATVPSPAAATPDNSVSIENERSRARAMTLNDAPVSQASRNAGRSLHGSASEPARSIAGGNQAGAPATAPAAPAPMQAPEPADRATVGAAAGAPAGPTPESAPKAMAKSAAGAPQADSTQPALPDDGPACVALVESLDRQARTADARRLYDRCRERFPAQVFPAALERTYSGR